MWEWGDCLATDVSAGYNDDRNEIESERMVNMHTCRFILVVRVQKQGSFGWWCGGR